MSSNYSDRLKLELMTTGANANTWGTNTNNNLDVIDAFAAGYLAKSVAGSANITLSTANASDTAESSNKTIELTGALTGDIVVFIPAVESEYNFFNNTSGSQTLTIAATGHTANGIAIAQGAKTTVFCDGASNFNVEIISSTDAGALGSGTLPDARFPATLPAASGVNLTSLNASNLGSGTVPDARFPATLPAADGSALTALNATNIASGTLGSDRLPTVPTTKGGTGLTSVGSAGQVLTVSAPGSTLEFADAAGGGDFTQEVFNSSGTYTKPDNLVKVKVTCIGGGGTGGNASRPPSNFSTVTGGRGGVGGYSQEVIPAASIPGPVSVTVGSGAPGGTSSFGSFLSATGGSSGNNTSGNSNGSTGSPGNGSGGDINQSGISLGGDSNSFITFSGTGASGKPASNNTNAVTPSGIGAGGGGGARKGDDTINRPASNGTGGRVIVESIF
jgi:hypothetical protein